LDVDPDISSDQAYQTGSWSSTVSPDGSTITISDVDAPTTGFPLENKETVAVDVRYRFYLYLTWRWIQYINDVPYSVFYPLAYTKWEVNFYAMPSNQINVKNGITSDGSNTYTRSNAPPEGMDMNSVFNNSTQWV